MISLQQKALTQSENRMAQSPIRPANIPFLRNFTQFKAKPLDFWLETGQMAPIIRVRFGPREIWVVTEADWFQHIFQQNARNYPREGRLRIDKQSDEKAHTVFTAPSWDEWLWRRRLLQPAFHRRKISQFAGTMVSEAQQLVHEWQATELFDLRNAMKTLTMRIIGRTMFSATMQKTAILQHAFETVTEFSFRTAAAIWPVPLWVPTPLNRRVNAAFAQREAIIGEIVTQRYAQTSEETADLLDMLIAAKLEESDRQFTASDLLAEMLSIIFAGHETTAMTLTWFFYLLTQMPEVAEKVQAEVEGILQGRAPTLADLPKMPYTLQVLQEVLRLYPSVYATLREADGVDVFGGYDVPAGTKFLLNIRGLHRSDRYWSDPNTFKPERFTPEKSAKRHKFAYQPFISGPKKCIGDSFAMMEMQLVIPTILQKVRLDYVGTEAIRPVAGFVMDTSDKVRVTATPR